MNTYVLKRMNIPLLRGLSADHSKRPLNSESFEPVFKFPFVKYLAVLNRTKIYHLIGTSMAVPGCGILEMSSIVPQGTFLTASYIGLTGLAVLSTATLPFRNIIGLLYISEDNKYIKISSVDYWGRRKDKIISAEQWIPLTDMPPKKLDPLYLTPKLSDGSSYKLFVKFGEVCNANKMAEFLE